MAVARARATTRGTATERDAPSHRDTRGAANTARKTPAVIVSASSANDARLIACCTRAGVADAMFGRSGSVNQLCACRSAPWTRTAAENAVAAVLPATEP